MIEWGQEAGDVQLARVIRNGEAKVSEIGAIPWFANSSLEDGWSYIT